jgi:hypothetical protein
MLKMTRCPFISGHILIFLLTCPLHPTDTHLLNFNPFFVICILLTFPVHQKAQSPHLYNYFPNHIHYLLTFVSVCRYLSKSMVPKSKKLVVEENPFLPLPIDLDQIPLVDKDYLISETKCEFDLVQLQSWSRDTFIYQSDEINLWESNFPLDLFPQIHHFTEFTLKCQAHYLPDQRAIVSSSGKILFSITPKAIE